jgi:hypothetical protein
MVRDGDGPPIRVNATINDKAAGEAAIKDTDGWSRFDWDTRAFENTAADVTLTITGTLNVEQRFCLTLDAR